MAVIEAIPGLTAEVVVDGAALHEYDNDEDESVPNQVTKYIEAVSGARFEVHFDIKRPFTTDHDIAVLVYIDGKEVDGQVFANSELPLRSSMRFRGARERVRMEYYVRDFLFSELNTDDRGHGRVKKRLSEKLKGVGDISVRFYRISIQRNVPPEGKSDLLTGSQKLGLIPEKALKGRSISHQASFATRKPTASFECVDITYLDGGRDSSFAKVNFKYRSKAALKSLLIVPRSPSPVPLEERDPDDLTLEEMRELIKRQREREKALLLVKKEGIKRERSENDDNGVNDEGVCFVSSKRRRDDLSVTVNNDGTETIDLTL